MRNFIIADCDTIVGFCYVMDPRTATADFSIWRPVGERQFHDNIRELWKATHGRPKEPQTYPIPREWSNQSSALPMTLELQLSNGIAFISSAKKGVETVSAVAIQVPQDASDGLRLNLAANEQISQAVKKCLDQVVTVVRKAARGETTRLQCKDDLLTLVLKLHRPRIHDRLRGKRGRHLAREGLHGILAHLTSQSVSSQSPVLAERLEQLCGAMEKYCGQNQELRTIEDLRILVTACYNFFSDLPEGESMKNALHQAGVDVDESRGNPHFRQIGKIASIYHVTEILSMIASHREFRRLCVNLSIRYIAAYKTVTLPIPAVDGGSRDCRVHAEVQLVVDLDSRSISKWYPPRVIGSSKAPCYLCEMFLNEHGVYFVPRTHGILTPRWTMPDLKDFNERQVSRYRRLIEEMNRKFQQPPITSLGCRLNPAMSWQALSQLNLALTGSLSNHQINSVLSMVQENSANSANLQESDRELSQMIAELPEPPIAAISEELERPKSRTEPHTRQKPEVMASGLQLDSTLELADRTVLRRDLLRSFGAESDPSFENSSYSGQQLSDRRRQRQARSFIDLNSERLMKATPIIRDHESRACEMLLECGMNGRLQRCSLPFMPHSNNIRRKIDFHDTDLSLEVEIPKTAQMVVIQCPRPEDPKAHSVIEIDKLLPGINLELDTGESLTGNRALFLTMIDQDGLEKWWKCLWKTKSEEKDM